MAPKRGGGSSSGGSSSGSSGSSGYSGSSSSSSDSYYGYDSDYDSLFAGICALLAFTCLVLVVALAAAVMVSMKSWLRQTGSRNIPRLAIFLSALLLIVLSRVLQIAILAPTIQVYNGSSNVSLDSQLDMTFAFSFFDLIAFIIIFVIAAIETYRGNGIVAQKYTIPEIANYGIIAFLLIIGIAAFGQQTHTTLELYDYSYSSYYSAYDFYNAFMAIRGLWMTYVVIAFLFASGILVKAFISSPGEPSSPSRKRYLLIFGAALWLYQLFFLVIQALSLFGTSGNQTVSVIALECVIYVFLIIIIIAITLLAWTTFKDVRNNANTTTTPAPVTQPPAENVPTEKAHEIYTPTDTANATAPAAHPQTGDSTWQSNYDTSTNISAATTTFRPSAGAP